MQCLERDAADTDVSHRRGPPTREAAVGDLTASGAVGSSRQIADGKQNCTEAGGWRIPAVMSASRRRISKGESTARRTLAVFQRKADCVR